MPEAQKAHDPTDFRDSLKARAANARFRNVGNPYAFLDHIGILAVKEFIYKGNMLIDIAEQLNIPVTTLKNWIELNEYEQQIQDALILSAEGYIQKGEKMLAEARSPFELNKAKAMIEHGRFMASKKDKKTYGNTVELPEGLAAVHYSFIIPAAPTVELGVAEPQTKPISIPLEAEYKRVTLDVANLDLGTPPCEDQIRTFVEPIEVEDAE